jgi:hypothetical protein
MNLAFILVTFIFSGGNPQPRIVSATAQEWHAGNKGGGMGTDYTIQFLTHQQNIRMDSLWIGTQGTKCFANPLGKDTISIRATIESLQPFPYNKAPLRFKGEGLVRYFVKSKTYYLVIKHFRKLPLINYP